MGLTDMNGILSQLIDDIQVVLEHIRVLVIFDRDVLCYGCREGEAVSFAKGQEEDVASHSVSARKVMGIRRGVYTKPPFLVVQYYSQRC